MKISQATEIAYQMESVRQIDPHRHILMCCILLEIAKTPQKEFPYLEALTNASNKDFEKAIELAKAVKTENPELSARIDAVISYIRREWLNHKKTST